MAVPPNQNTAEAIALSIYKMPLRYLNQLKMTFHSFIPIRHFGIQRKQVTRVPSQVYWPDLKEPLLQSREDSVTEVGTWATKAQRGISPLCARRQGNIRETPKRTTSRAVFKLCCIYLFNKYFGGTFYVSATI